MAAAGQPAPEAPPEPPPPLEVVRRRGLGTLAALPDDVLCWLLQWSALEVPDLLRLSQCSRLLRVLVCEEPLWLCAHLERCRRRPFDYRVSAESCRLVSRKAGMPAGCWHAARGSAACCLPLLGASLRCLVPRAAAEPAPALQGSWRATYFAHHPACGRPDLTAADMVPLAPVPGFASEILYRRWYRCHVDLSTFVPPPPDAATAAPAAAQPPTAQLPAAPSAAGGEGGVGASGSAATGRSIPYLPDAGGLSAEEFEARFDGPGQPVLLGGLTADWPGAGGAQAAGSSRRCGRE